MMCLVLPAKIDTVMPKEYHDDMMPIFRWSKRGVNIYILENILGDPIPVRWVLQWAKRGMLHHCQRMTVFRCTVQAVLATCTNGTSLREPHRAPDTNPFAD
jgi:hypothetical protein